jgi:hypothetical protein
MKLAELMSRGALVPSHLQGKPADCLMVIELAMRLQMSPFAVAQCTSVISGKIMLEGKLVGAALNASHILEGRMQYDFDGEGDSRKVTATARVRGAARPESVTVEYAKVKTSNGMWAKQPDQQLIYSANRIWARRHAPEVMLGVYSDEEWEVTRQERDEFSGETIDGTTTHAPADPVTPYGIQTTKGLREYPTLAAWKEGWEKAVKAYVAANAYDKLTAMRDMNEDLFRAIAEQDAAAVIEVRNMIGMNLGDAPVGDA